MRLSRGSQARPHSEPTQTTQSERRTVKGAAALQPDVLSCFTVGLWVDSQKTRRFHRPNCAAPQIHTLQP